MRTSLKKLLKVATYDIFYSQVKINHAKLNKKIIVSSDEAVALYAYTNCHPPIYKEVNFALRNGDNNHFLIKLIDKALKTLPIYQTTAVYRWSNPTADEQFELKNNKIVTENAYLSTLKEPNQIDMAESDCLLIKIAPINGRDISLYSDDFSVKIQEILIPRGSSFSYVNEAGDYDLVLKQVS